MATLPLTNFAAQVTATGIQAPSYADILESFKLRFREIYGDDAYLEPDSQDGQFLAIMSLALHDCNQSAVSVYNSFSPVSAVGAGLSSVVKINHLTRQIATPSSVNLTITGQAGTIITNGKAGDGDGNKWLMPGSVLIPPGGSILVTAMAEDVGAVQAPANTVTEILTPVAGWQTVTNLNPAVPGEAIESDAALRKRQEQAPSLSSQSTLAGLAAALNALAGVTYGTIYENDQDDPDSNGLPGHSIGVVVAGGDATAIAQTIYDRKGPGVNTFGGTTVNIPDVSGALRPIHFSTPQEIPIAVDITLTAGDGYTNVIRDAIKQAVADYINGMDIGEDLVVNRLYTPALLNGLQPDSETYVLGTIEAGTVASGVTNTTPITIAYTSKATCDPAAVTITLL